MAMCLECTAKLAECPRWDERLQTPILFERLILSNYNASQHSIKNTRKSHLYEEIRVVISLDDNGGFIVRFRSGVVHLESFHPAV